MLRFVLYDVWGKRCYWCHRPTDFNAIQIDHLLPQQAGRDRLEELKTTYGLPDDFDIHDPANLAPICIDCNGRRGKSNDEYGPVPAFLSQLDKARQRRDTVIKQVKNIGLSTKITEHLLAASTANLHDARIREAFEEHAPAIVQRLALLDEKKVDFLTMWYVDTTIEDDKPLSVGLSLNARGRATAEILEGMCRISLEDVLQERVAELERQIRKYVHADLETIEAPAGPPTAGPPVTTFIRIDIDLLDYQNTGPALEFTFHGNFEASMSASLSQCGPDGGELLELQGDTVVFGTFSFVVSWHFSADHADVDRGECVIGTWESDTHTS
ncbi:hypothetical protein CLM62_43895 [Streptomyces sp. SA15]|nr:hypothetical protein CLM62_43895 [Streptomyces sp. SA15]